MQCEESFYKSIEKNLEYQNIQDAEIKMKSELKGLANNKNILITGSGGSYVTALYAKHIIEKKLYNLCETFKPMEVLQTNLELYSYAILYSYSMENYDIIKVLDYILKKDNLLKIIIITAKQPNIPYKDPRILYICYNTGNEYEKKYVSYKGIYIPTFILGSCFEKLEMNLEKLNNAKMIPIRGETLDVFYDKDNYCLAQLMERHLCELGIATVRVHEKRDFSHGRMNILKEKGEVMFLNSYSYDKKYDMILMEYLKNVYHSNILNKKELESNIKLNYFEKLLLTLYWIKECSEKYGISLENKKDTKEDEKLFKYM